MKKQRIKIKKQRNAQFLNIMIVSLFFNGIIMHPKKLFQYMGALTYHVMWILSVMKTLTCILTSTNLHDLYTGILIAHILAMLLWWNLYIRKDQIQKFVSRMSFNQPRFKCLATALIVSVILVLFPVIPLYIDMIHRGATENHPIPGPRPCRFFRMTNYTEMKQLLNAIEIIRPHISYCIFYCAFLLYFVCGFLTWRNLQYIERRIYLENSYSVWEKLKHTVTTVKELERVLSLPIFLLLSKIAVDIFNGVSALCSGHRAAYSKFVFVLTVPQQTVWFLIIIAIADLVQSESLKIINASFARLRHSGAITDDLSYLEYKTMKAAIHLTAGNMFRINRGLLLKAFTSSITYGVIITQFKDNGP